MPSTIKQLRWLPSEHKMWFMAEYSNYLALSEGQPALVDDAGTTAKPYRCQLLCWKSRVGKHLHSMGIGSVLRSASRYPGPIALWISAPAWPPWCPNQSQSRYHGVFGKQQTSCTGDAGKAGQEKLKAPDEMQDQTLSERRAAMTWAQRLKCVFNIDIETDTGCVNRLFGTAPEIPPRGCGPAASRVLSGCSGRPFSPLGLWSGSKTRRPVRTN